MSNVLKLSGALKVGNLSTDPANPQEGFIYFNTSSGTFRMYENGSFRDISAEALESHLDGGASKHDATEIDYERVDGSKKNIQASSDDVEIALTDLDDAIGALDQTPVNYTPTDPSIVADHLAAIDSALVLSGATEFSDSEFRIQDNADATKQIAVEASGISTATTRTITMPDADVDLGDIASNTASLSSHLNGGASKHDATEIDYERVDGSKVDIQATSDDVENALTDLDDNKISRTGAIAFTGNQSMGGNFLTNVADPSNAQDAATKAYVDSIAQGLSPHGSVRVATTANVDLANELENGDTVDNVVLVTGNRVLVRNQSDPVENGIYIVPATGAASRATDFDGSPDNEVSGGDWVYVEEGDTYGGSSFAVEGTGSRVVDTDAIVFVMINKVSPLAGGDGIAVVDGAVNAQVDDSTVEIVADQIRQKDAGTTNAKLANMAAWTIKARNNAVSGVPQDVALADLTEEAAPVAGDFLVGMLDTGELRKMDVDNLPVSASTQSSLDGKANTDLSNLASTAINTSLISDANNTDDLGSGANSWRDTYTKSIKSVDGLVTDADSDAGGDRANDHVVLARSQSRGKQASALLEEEYFDSIALLGSQTNTSIASLTFAHANYEGMEIVYKLKEATSNDVEIGTIRVVTNGASAVLSQVSTDTAPTGISFSAAINGANVEIRYSSGTNGATMRADVKRFRT